MSQQLGPYELEAELGRGGMGVVYRARDIRTGQIVALKVLLDLAANPAQLERFRREASALKGVEHPNLVRVLGLSLQPPRPYAVFEYVEGETLQARVEREGPLPWETAVRVLSEVAAGASTAHARNLLHRDIKPANVLLAESGAKLADFGLVKDLDAETLTQSGSTLGSPSYLAPEQIGSEKERWGPSTDVYGLASTLYFALTGVPPFSGPTTVATLTAVLGDPPPAPRKLVATVPEWLSAACRRGMAKPNEERFASAAAFREALQRGAVSVSPGRGRWGLAAGLLAIGSLLGLGWAALPDPGDPAQPAAVSRHELDAIPGYSALSWLPTELGQALRVHRRQKEFTEGADLLEAALADAEPTWKPAGEALLRRFRAEAQIEASPELAGLLRELYTAGAEATTFERCGAFLAKLEEVQRAGERLLAPGARDALAQRCHEGAIGILLSSRTDPQRFEEIGASRVYRLLLDADCHLEHDRARTLVSIVASASPGVFEPDLLPRLLSLGEGASAGYGKGQVDLARLNLSLEPPANEAAIEHLRACVALPGVAVRPRFDAALLAMSLGQSELVLELIPVEREGVFPRTTSEKGSSKLRMNAYRLLGRHADSLREIRRLQAVVLDLDSRADELAVLIELGRRREAATLLRGVTLREPSAVLQELVRRVPALSELDAGVRPPGDDSRLESELLEELARLASDVKAERVSTSGLAERVDRLEARLPAPTLPANPQLLLQLARLRLRQEPPDRGAAAQHLLACGKLPWTEAAALVAVGAVALQAELPELALAFLEPMLRDSVAAGPQEGPLLRTLGDGYRALGQEAQWFETLATFEGPAARLAELEGLANSGLRVEARALGERLARGNLERWTTDQRAELDRLRASLGLGSAMAMGAAGQDLDHVLGALANLGQRLQRPADTTELLGLVAQALQLGVQQGEAVERSTQRAVGNSLARAVGLLAHDPDRFRAVDGQQLHHALGELSLEASVVCAYVRVLSGANPGVFSPETLESWAERGELALPPKESPEHSSLLVALARLKFRLEPPDTVDAARLLYMCKERNPSAKDLLEASEVALNGQRFALVIDLIGAPQQVGALDLGDRPKAYRLLGYAHRSLGRSQEWLERLQAEFGEHDPSAERNLALARTLRGLDRGQEALGELSRVLNAGGLTPRQEQDARELFEALSQALGHEGGRR